MALFDFGFGGGGLLGGGDGYDGVPQSRGFFGGLEDRFNSPLVQFGLGLASGGTPQEGFGNALSAIQFRQKLAQANLTGDIREYQYDMMQRGARGEDRIPFSEWRKQNNAINEKSFGNPLFDEEGNVKVLTDKGRLITPQGAEGFKGMKSTREIDTGTEKITVNAQTGAVIDRRPYNAEERAAATARGKTTGTAQATAAIDLPQIETTANNAIRYLDELKNHPGRKDATGPLAGRVTALGGAQADFVSRLQQIENGAFVNTYKNDLKGGGAISNIEGEKGTKARARMSRITRPEDFDAAIEDYKALIRQDQENARKRAAGPSSGTSRIKKYNPETGRIE